MTASWRYILTGFAELMGNRPAGNGNRRGDTQIMSVLGANLIGRVQIGTKEKDSKRKESNI